MGSPFTLSLTTTQSFISPKFTKTSFRHFNKHLVCTFKTTPKWPQFTPTNINSSRNRSHFIPPLKNSYTNTPIVTNLDNINNLENLGNFLTEALKKCLKNLNIVKVLKWLVFGAVAVGSVKWGVGVLASPFFWMYFSWTWVFWPWYVAIGVASYGVYGFVKLLRGEGSVSEQLGVVVSVFTWLTLVPPGYVNGFLEGWPFVFFFVYHYFFFLNVSIRKRMYGDFYPREHDAKWDVATPVWQRGLFCLGVMAAHWFAAFEGPQLHLIPGGWRNLGVWGLIMSTVFLQYYSSLYLAKYSEKVVVPTAVVQFGPYRWVRHPIYASTGLLFLSYFVALQAPLSSLFVVAVCLMYYDQKAKLEEGLMVDTFGDGYTEYMKKVRYKFIPFVY